MHLTGCDNTTTPRHPQGSRGVSRSRPQLQLEDTIERLETVSVGMLMPDRAAPVADAELLGLDELGDVELGDVELGDVELGDVEAELALRSSVPVIRTL